MANEQMRKKLTVRDVMGSPIPQVQAVRDMLAAGLKGDKPAPVALCRIVGRASKAKPGHVEKTNSDFVRFYGEFVGVNLLTGERLAAGSAILPGAAESLLYGAMGELDERGQGSLVEFGIEIGARFEESAIAKYVYEVRSLVEVKASDPMQALLDKAGALALPAPQDSTDGGNAGKGGKGKGK